MTRRNTNEDFWKKVSVTDDPEECWEFQGFANSKGYSHYYHDNTYSKAHIYAYELVFGSLENQGLHGCDNPRCCNPNHIYDGTEKDNVLDRIISGRSRHARGEEQGSAKLNIEEVNGGIL